MHDYTGNGGSPGSLRNPDPARNNASDLHAKNFVSQSKFFSVVVDRRPLGQQEGWRGKRWAESSEKTRGHKGHAHIHRGWWCSDKCSKVNEYFSSVFFIRDLTNVLSKLLWCIVRDFRILKSKHSSSLI